jgi:signal peptidase I
VKAGKAHTTSLLLAAGVILAVGLIRTFCISSYRISTTAMENTLYKGDYVLVNKLSARHPERNHILFFTSPLIKDRANPPLLVGRCVALPGDTILVSDEAYTINGVSWPRSPNTLLSYAFGKEISTPFLEALRKLNIPQRNLNEAGTRATLRLTPFEEYCIREELSEELNRRFARLEAERYRIIAPRRGETYSIDGAFITACSEAILTEANERAEFLDNRLFIDGFENTTFRFSRDYYWVLSDNTDEAVDSRHVGFIPAENIIGNAWFCWYSSDKERRFKRIN